MLSLDRLQSFLVFVDSKNIFEAAEKLGMAQPTLSVHLKQLEEELGSSLFALKGKKKVLNPFGRAIYDNAKAQVEALNSSLENIKMRHKDLNSVTLKVGGRREILSLAAHRLLFPGNIQFLSMGSRQAVEELKEHKIDIALTHVLPDSADLYSRKFLKNSSQFVIPKKLLGSRKLSLKLFTDKAFLKETPFISYKENETLFQKWCEINNLSKTTFNEILQIDDWKTVIELVDSGLGFSLAPSAFAANPKTTATLSVSEKIIPAVQFYALYGENLKSVAPIHKVFNLS